MVLNMRSETMNTRHTQETVHISISKSKIAKEGSAVGPPYPRKVFIKFGLAKSVLKKSLKKSLYSPLVVYQNKILILKS